MHKKIQKIAIGDLLTNERGKPETAFIVGICKDALAKLPQKPDGILHEVAVTDTKRSVCARSANTTLAYSSAGEKVLDVDNSGIKVK